MARTWHLQRCCLSFPFWSCFPTHMFWHMPSAPPYAIRGGEENACRVAVADAHSRLFFDFFHLLQPQWKWNDFSAVFVTPPSPQPSISAIGWYYFVYNCKYRTLPGLYKVVFCCCCLLYLVYTRLKMQYVRSSLDGGKRPSAAPFTAPSCIHGSVLNN